jgi:spermidine synthase
MLKNVYLHSVVAIGAATVFALELLGTRILAPFYGTSQSLWLSLIRVILAALSVGFLLGGSRADKNAQLSHICLFVAGAGLWIMIIPWIKHPMMRLVDSLGFTTAIFAATGAFFFLPCMFLGLVLPYAIKLKTEVLDNVGRTVGIFFALSMIASIASALITSLYLIPFVGVNLSLFCLGVLLLVIAVIGLLIANTSKPTTTGVSSMLLPAMVAYFMLPSEAPDTARGVFAIEQSPYATLRVLDTEAGRHLTINEHINAVIDTTTWESELHYAGVMDLAKNFFDRPGKVLIIGLGGGSLAKQYAKDGWSVDVVETDPVVIKLARKYFELQPKDGNIIEMDGRRFLNTTTTMYDVILLDVCNSGSMPFHLVTKEAFGRMRSHLSDGGVLAVNIETTQWDDPIVTTLAATLKQEFKDIAVFPIEEPPNTFGNMVFFASESLRPKRIPESNTTFDPNWRYTSAYQKVHAWDNQFIPDTKHARILTDELNPIDLRLESIHRISRQELRRYYEKNGLNW